MAIARVIGPQQIAKRKIKGPKNIMTSKPLVRFSTPLENSMKNPAIPQMIHTKTKRPPIPSIVLPPFQHQHYHSDLFLT